MSIELALRLIGGVLAGIGAWSFAVTHLPEVMALDIDALFWALSAVAAASFGIAFLLVPYVTSRPYLWLLDTLARMDAGDVVVAVSGLLAGLLVGGLLALPIASLPPPLGQFLPLTVSVLGGYAGVVTGLSHRNALLGGPGLPWEWRGGGRGGESRHVVVDTSAIIDGRIAEIARAGFLPGQLIVPKVVLSELQRIADSPDQVRRARGRHGLEVLTRLQHDESVRLDIREIGDDGLVEVDAQLVGAARALGCPIVTNDYNLNRVAGLQGVAVLNVNELSNALRPVVLPGEEMCVRIIQEGKEFGQGVAFLDDGTMVVVENGRHHLNSTVDVVVSRVLQTVTGRMIFAQPRHSSTAPAYRA